MDKTKNPHVRRAGLISWTEQEAMIKEYLTGNYTKVEVWRKYTGQDEEHGQLLLWMRKLGYTTDERRKFVPLHRQPEELLNSETNNQDPIELQRQIKELKKQFPTSSRFILPMKNRDHSPAFYSPELRPFLLPIAIVISCKHRSRQHSLITCRLSLLIDFY